MVPLSLKKKGYGSDADVLFVYEAADDVDEAAARFAQEVARRLRASLRAPGGDPPVEVDANLRPEGRDGPLARSLASYAAYYRRWSSVWEAQALLRARPFAGDDDLGRRFRALIEPLRYPVGGIGPDQVREIRRGALTRPRTRSSAAVAWATWSGRPS